MYDRSGHYHNRWDYFLVVMIVALSGNMALVDSDRRDVFYLLFALIGCLRMASLNRSPKPISLLVYVSFFALFLLQGLELRFFAFVTITGFLTKLTIAMATVLTVYNFRYVLVQVMTWIVKLSLVFHLPVILAGMAGVRLYEYFEPIARLVGVPQHDVQVQVNIGLHNFQTDENLFRNAGMFWEPGAFSGYIILALMILATAKTEFSAKIRRNYSIWLVVGVLSTLSTTGIVILPFALFAFLLSRSTTQEYILTRMAKIILVAVSIFIMVPHIWQLDFVGQKITLLWYRAIFEQPGWELSRFGSVIFDWAYIAQRPFLGWGQSNATQYSLDPYLYRHALGNGFTGYLRQMGVFGMSILVIYLWIGLRKMKVNFVASAWFVTVILLLLNGQYFMDYPLFLTLHFLGTDRSSENTLKRQPRSLLNRSVA